jgi:hypothetical protein
MSGIGRTRGESEPAPDNDRARGVERRFNAISDERISISKNTGRDFDEGKGYIDGEADESQAGAGLQIARHSASGRMSVHAQGND